MSEEHILRYTDLAALVQMARARGWTTDRIVREMSAGLTYSDALNLDRKAAAARYFHFRVYAAAAE